MRSSLVSLALSRRMLPAYIGCVLLLAVCAYGFSLYAPAQAGRLYYLLWFGFVPLILLFIIAVRAAMGIEQQFLSTGYISRIDQLQKRLNAQDDFIRSITDYAPSAMTIFNNDNEYWFVNSRAADNLKHSGANIIGKTPVALLGGEEGRKIERILDQVRQSGEPSDTIRQVVSVQGEISYLQTHYEPMQAIGEFAGGIGAREEDVTRILIDRQRSETMLRQVISTLVGVVDRRDPYASGHSSRVGLLARAIAAEMHLPERECETAEISGSLMNFGKVLVSRSILTKASALSPDEFQRIRDGIMTSADILSMINFGMPVVPTLRQVLERFDGTGVPEGLKGSEILVTARIVAVANAFIAMVSPRAYRPGIELQIAADRLQQESGTVFDAKVITALQDYLHKNAGKLGWLMVGKSS